MFHFFGPTHAWKYASVVHVISWVMQIFGHRYFESLFRYWFCQMARSDSVFECQNGTLLYLTTWRKHFFWRPSSSAWKSYSISDSGRTSTAT